MVQRVSSALPDRQLTLELTGASVPASVLDSDVVGVRGDMHLAAVSASNTDPTSSEDFRARAEVALALELETASTEDLRSAYLLLSRNATSLISSFAPTTMRRGDSQREVIDQKVAAVKDEFGRRALYMIFQQIDSAGIGISNVSLDSAEYLVEAGTFSLDLCIEDTDYLESVLTALRVSSKFNSVYKGMSGNKLCVIGNIADLPIPQTGFAFVNPQDVLAGSHGSTRVPRTTSSRTPTLRAWRAPLSPGRTWTTQVAASSVAMEANEK